MNKIMGTYPTMNSRTMPRALVGTVRAEADNPAHMIQQIGAAFTDFRARNDARLDYIEAFMDQQIQSSALQRLGGNEAFNAPADRDYTKAFASYFRKGDAEGDLRRANSEGERATIQAAMSVGTNSDGGYLAPVEWDRRVLQKLKATSPMRQIAQVQPTSVGAYSTIWNNDAWGSGWVGESAGRPQTSNASLSQLVFEAGEIYAMPAATQRLLDDSAISVESWLADSVEAEFARQEGIAFISGDGANKPRGLLTYITGGASDGHHPGGNLEVFNSGSATDIPGGDALIDFKYTLTAPYRQNASWLMNSQTAATIAKLKDNDGNYLWREGLTADEPARLLGRPVYIDEAMPDIAGDAYPIAFGDFMSGYIVNDRLGIRVLRDPFTSKPFVLFYTTKRVGGGVLDPNAIKLMKIATAA